MRVLVACEFSGIVSAAFRKRGHDAWSCDLLPSEGDPAWHIQGDVLDILDWFWVPKGMPGEGRGWKWDMMIAHPPCTYLTVTANKWLKDQPRRKSGALVGAERRAAREEAVMFFTRLANAPIEKVCIENPVGTMSTRWRKPDQIVCPTMFGHKEPKKTCLWLKGLPKLEPTDIVEPEYSMTKSGKRIPTWYHMPSPSDRRQKDRNRTFTGIANAMASQWG